MSGKVSDKKSISELPNGVKENLSTGEEVVDYLKTFQVVERPDYIILTNLRLLFFNEKHLGRYEFKSMPFQKLLEMKAQRGTLLWGDISFKGEDGTEIMLEKVDRGDLDAFIEALKTAYNGIAVEPISIRYQKNLLGKASWEFNKPAETLFRQLSPKEVKPAEDPLGQLKMRFVRGEISEEEYRTKLRVLQEK
jgi:hypothetical protein